MVNPTKEEIEEIAQERVDDCGHATVCYGSKGPLTANALVGVLFVFGLIFGCTIFFGHTLPAIEKSKGMSPGHCTVLNRLDNVRNCTFKGWCANDVYLDYPFCTDRIQNGTSGPCIDSEADVCLQNSGYCKRPRCKDIRCDNAKSGLEREASCRRFRRCCRNGCVLYGKTICYVTWGTCWSPAVDLNVTTLKGVRSHSLECTFNDEACLDKFRADFVQGSTISCYTYDDGTILFKDPRPSKGLWIVVFVMVGFILLCPFWYLCQRSYYYCLLCRLKPVKDLEMEEGTTSSGLEGR
jgi:hypothetical protein